MTSVGVWVAAFLTLSIFSFLYKDNPFYKFAEHLMVGVSAGYWVILLFYNVLLPDAIDPLFTEGKWYYIIPLILGLLMWTRLFKKTAWISRYPLAFYLGIATGVAIPLEMKAKVIEQLYGSVGLVVQMHEMDAGFGTVINNVVILVGVLSSLIYFFFSKAHTGITGRVSQLGIGVLMIGFGASFGFTVMARVSLLIERVQFLLFEWLKLGA